MRFQKKDVMYAKRDKDRGKDKHLHTTITNNTTDHDIDAMGILYLYLLEKNFVPPAPAKVAQTASN